MKRFNQLLKKCTNYMQNESKNGSGSSRFASLSILSRQSVLTIFCLLLLGTGQVWGWNSISGGKRLYYFNNSSDNWNAVWIHIWKNSETWDYGLTQVGSTSYWYYDSGNGWAAISGFDFYKVNHHGDSKTSSIYGNVSNSTVFIRNSDWSNVFWNTSYFYVSPSGGATVYFDNTDFGFTADKIYFRAGFGECNEAFLMSKVNGTSNLYKIVLPNSYPYAAYTISQKSGYTNLNSIYNVGGNDAGGDYHIAKQLVYKSSDANITGDFTIYYKELGDNNLTENCQYYNYYTFSGHTRNVSITEPTGGTITVSYYDESNIQQTFTSGTTAVAQTCKIQANPVAARGYTYRASSLQIGGGTYAENTDYIVRGDVSVSATFDPKSYTTVNLDHQGGTSSQNKLAATVTTASAYGALSSVPVKNGYHFMGYFSATGGNGSKYFNEDGSATEAAWFVDANTDVATPTLYAYYVMDIESITFTPTTLLPNDDVKLTLNFADEKEPEGTYSFCYVLTTGTGSVMQVQPTFTPTDEHPGEVTFTVPGTPGQYSVKVYLFSGDTPDCEGYTTNLIDSYTSYAAAADKFTVEASNAVTVEYKCGDVELRPSTTVYATSNQTTAIVTAPEIEGLTFDHWNYDGAIISAAGGTNDQSNPIQIHASVATTLTAIYNQSGYVYFKNTLGWEHVYLYKYNNKSYWGNGGDGNYGTGAQTSEDWGNRCTAQHLEMGLVPGTSDVYFIKPGVGVPSSGQSFVFTNKPSEEDFFGERTETSIEIVRVNDDYSSTNHMVVPEVGTTETKYDGRATYYTRYFFAPTLTFWGWNLRGNWDGIGASSWTNSNYWYNFTSNTFGSLEFTAKRYCDQGNFIHYIQVYTDRTAGGGIGWGKSAAVIDGLTTTPTPLNSTDGSRNITFKTTVAGEYLFVLTFGPSGDARGSLTNNIELSVIYPVVVGDSRLVYTGGTNPHPGNVIKKRANGEDVVDMYVAEGQSDKIKIQSCTAVGNTSVTWGTLTNPTYAAGVDFASILSAGGPGTYSFTIVQDANGANPTITKVEKYTGPYYIRTDCVNSDKWNYMDSKEEHIMHYSDYSMTQTTEPYSHYFTKWIAGSDKNQTKIRFTVATDYSESISDTLLGDAILGEGEPQVYNTNVRFMYNYETNALSRAYTQGPTDPLYMILRTPYVEESGDNHAWIYKSWTSNSSYTRFSNPQTIDDVNVDTVRFKDLGNWVYQADVYARPNAPIKLTGNFSGTRYFKGTSGTSYSTTGVSPDAEKLIGGTGAPQHMRIVYDFKTNRMITSWLPPESAISGDYKLEADILLIREHQESADAITFASGDGNMLENVKKVYGVMKFNKSTLNDPTYSRYERDLYWISFPFNVNLSDVFGFGEYGTHWIIERYDGIGRAKNGFWADSPSNWKFVTPYQRDSGWVLNANEGYILALDLDELDTESSVWDNSVSTGYLYFPSSTDIGTIKATSKTVNFTNQSEYKCNIGPRFDGGDDRRIKDSYWHCIGVPSFAGAGQSISSAGIDYGSPEEWTANIPFVYRWNSTNNTLSVATGSSSMTFAAMYSYLVQFSGSSLSWTGVTNTPSSVAARLAETPDREYQLALIREEEEQDHTYVRLTDDASVTNSFEFNYDLSKEYNAGRGNIWTVTADTVEVAGNSMPKPLQTTLVPVGVKVVANGDYTFSMPEGTNGEDVYLIDNAYGTRTNLGLMPYTVTLTAGTYDSRFALEFGPIQDAPTGIEQMSTVNYQLSTEEVRKVFVGGRLYIIRDGKVYDAAGQRIE